MGQVVVAVVDDLIIKVHAVVLVGGISRERCQVAQVDSGLVSGAHQVTTQLVLIVILVGQLLQGLHDAVGIEDRVGLLVERRVEYLTVAVGLEHIRA